MMRARSADDFTTIADRVKQSDRDRMASIAGCNCQAGADGNVNHREGCALYPGVPPATPPVLPGLPT